MKLQDREFPGLVDTDILVFDKIKINYFELNGRADSIVQMMVS